ncbi:MAG: hypothetical protein A2V78_01415 [Betaproteobacteria bacterium RBG_16_64_18]|nr:MAG: hypothetical protein A2V78_01415 [Betaproteobacteria bacterium RBG_16_64_18]
MGHLRLPNNKTASFAQRVVQATNALIADYGPTIAFTRLAGIPVAIPQSILQAFRAMSATERKLALTRLCSDGRTPLRLLQTLFLFRKVAEGDDRAIFDATVDRLLDGWRKTAELFTAVLKWTNAAYAHDSDWVALSAADRLALVWTHADRLTGFLLEMQFDTERITRDFAANHRQATVHQRLHLDPGYHDAAANPDTIGPDCLLFHGLGYVLDGDTADSVLSSAHLASARDLLTMEAEGTRVTSVWLFANRECANNDLSSFFVLRPKGLPTLDASPAAVSQTIDSLLRELETDSTSSTAWIGVLGLGNPALAPSDRERLLAVLENVDLRRFVERDADDMFLCRLVVDCWSRLGDRDSYPKIVVRLERLAAHLALQHQGVVSTTMSGSLNSAAHRDLSQLVEAAALSARAADGPESFSRLGDALVRLAAAWPNAAPLFRVILSNVMVREPTALSKELWKSLLVMRTY